MKIEDSIRGLIAILFIALCSSRPAVADDRYALHYDHPIDTHHRCPQLCQFEAKRGSEVREEGASGRVIQ